MSSQIFPSLPGQGIEIVRSYVWKTGNQEALSGKQSAIGYRQYPLVHFELTYNVLRDVGAPAFNGSSEIQLLVGFHNQMQGRFDTFLFTDPEFNTITPANSGYQGIFGTGDGTTAAFQLQASYQVPLAGQPGNHELIQNLNGTPILYDNGSTISAANYSIGATGIVTFGAGHIPAAGHVLTWSGSWYYRCRFDEDALTYKRFMSKLWSVDIKMTSVKLVLAMFLLSPLLSLFK